MLFAMEDDRWYQPEEIATLLGIKPESVVKRAKRFDETSKEAFVRRVPSTADGGKPRVEIHASLVSQWLPPEGNDAGPSDHLVQNELRMSRQSNSHLHAQLLNLELSTRDSEIERLTEALMAREFEIAELRNENLKLSGTVEELGAMIASLTKAKK